MLFGPADYFSLMVLGLMFAVVLARGSGPRAIAIILVGILMSTVGTDLETGEERLTFGWTDISDGLNVAVLAMGMFGFAEILRNLESTQARTVVYGAIGNLLPNAKDFRQSIKPIGRGTLLGAGLGLLPGNGAVLGPFASYTLEKKLAADPSRFGRGAIEGVAGPESANNAGAQTAFIPLLTLGIPPNVVMALMVGAMTIHGIVPGPQIMSNQPRLFWGMIASMWIGNLMLLIINLPLIGLWVRFLKVPYRLLFPAIVLLCCFGIYSVGNSSPEVMMTAGFGLFGYAMIKFGFEPAPLLLGFVLGRLMEEKLRQALVISRGHFTTFVDCPVWNGWSACEHPISTGLLALAGLVLIIAVLPSIRRGRQKVFTEAG
jgi:putative tricarboxylic transport membrane protein